MIEWKEANEQLARAYNTRVPAYNLKPVLELLAGVSPKFITDTVTECIIMLNDALISGSRIPNARTQDMMFTLRYLWRAFSDISFDSQLFTKETVEQVANHEGCFANEPFPEYGK